MPPNKKPKYDWDAEVRAKNQRQPRVGNKPATFHNEPTTLAWLEKFASKRLKDRVAYVHLEEMFPWLWNSSWNDTVDVDVAGVKQLKDAFRHAEAMESSLNAFLQCVRDRLERIRRSLKVVAPMSYFPLLSDDVLAIIFEFASMPYSQATGDEYDNKSPSRISQVSRRFRNVALRLPRLWRYIDPKSDVKLIASRSAVAGAILEAHVKSEIVDYMYHEGGQRVEQLYSFLGRIATQSSKITVLRFDLSRYFDDNFLKKLHDAGKLTSLSFPSLRELVLNFDVKSDYRNVHFYKRWDMPALRLLKARNAIPEFRSKTVCEGINECSITLDRVHGPHEKWKMPKVTKFLSSLSSVTILDLLLHVDVLPRISGVSEIMSLPTVEHLRTAFPGMTMYSVRDFCDALKTPKKKRWILEIQPDEYDMKVCSMDTIFFPAKYNPRGAPVDTLNLDLKEVDIVFHCEFGSKNCDVLTKICGLVPNLERLTVTYVTVAEQLRRFELKDCKGKVAEMVKHLEERFDERLGVENPHFVIEGSEAQDGVA